MSNPNVITPYGNQTVSWGSGGAATPGTPATAGGYVLKPPDANGYSPGYVWQDGTPGTPGTPGGDRDQATITQTLTPAAEQTIREQQNAELNLARFANQQAMPMLTDVLSTPFSFDGTPQQSLGSVGGISNAMGPNPFASTYGATYGQVQGAPNLQGMGSAQSIAPGAGGSINQGLTGNQFGPAAGGGLSLDLQKSMNGGQYGMAGGGDYSGVAGMPVNAGTTAQQAIMSRLQPQIAQNRTSTETQLVNQGLRPGGEAYDNAINLLGQQENDQQTQAVLQGLNLDMSANQQGFGQAQARAQTGNQAIGQNFQQGLQAGQFGNEAQLASFGGGLQQQQMYNDALGQNFGQAATAQQLQNSAQQQGYAQAQGVVGAQNAALGQNQQAALAQQAAANQAQAQGFGNEQTMLGVKNQANQQNYNNQITDQDARNRAQQQQYSQLLQSAQFGNAAQQQALAQMLQERQVPMNEISALLSGSQIQNPAFQAFQGQQVQAAPIMQGAQAQAGWDQNLYNQQMSQRNAMTQGLFSLGGAAGGALGSWLGGR